MHRSLHDFKQLLPGGCSVIDRLFISKSNQTIELSESSMQHKANILSER
jgi:hypothetical protein